jgi:hypothetical protein
MRTTLTLIGDRVAAGADFVALGEGVNRTPGWRCLVVEFELEDGAPFGEQRFSYRWIGDIDTGKSVAPELTVRAMNAIARHCRQYANLHAPTRTPEPAA